jgi:hypothetical protein
MFGAAMEVCPVVAVTQENRKFFLNKERFLLGSLHALGSSDA